MIGPINHVFRIGLSLYCYDYNNIYLFDYYKQNYILIG